MTDQAQRLEIATVRAEIGSNITYRFNNDAIDALLIPTDSGDIKNLKQVIAAIQQEGAEKISFATRIYPTTAAGIASTVNGEIFLVASSDADEIYEVWKNNAGVALDTGKRAISASAVIAATDAAQASADSAQTAAAEATAKVAPFLSPAPTDPIVRSDGSSLQPGDTYFNTAIQAIKVYSLSGWVAANVTGVELTEAINTREPSISAGTTDQYWSGDKTFKTLDKSAVGLGSADNTSDANKPLSTAATAALNQKAPLDIVNVSAANLVALKALSTASVKYAYRQGYAIAGDGGASFWRYDSSSTATADDTIVVAPNNGAGRWLLNHAGTLPVGVAGARGDGVTDDFSAIQRAHATGMTVTYQPTKYICSSRVTATAPFGMIGGGIGRTYIDFTGSSQGYLVSQNNAADAFNIQGFTFLTGLSPSNGQLALKIDGAGQVGSVPDASGHLQINNRTMHRGTVRDIECRGRDITNGWSVGLNFKSIMNFASGNLIIRGQYNGSGDYAGVGVLVNGDGIPTDWSIDRIWTFYTTDGILMPDYVEGGHITNFEMVHSFRGIRGAYDATWSTIAPGICGALGMFIDKGHCNVRTHGVYLENTNQNNIANLNLYLNPLSTDGGAAGVYLQGGATSSVAEVKVNGDAALNTKANNHSVLLSGVSLSTVQDCFMAGGGSAVREVSSCTNNTVRHNRAHSVVNVVSSDGSDSGNFYTGNTGTALSGAVYATGANNQYTKAFHAQSVVRTLTGGATSEIFTVSFPTNTFSAKPTVVISQITGNTSTPSMVVVYDFDNAGNNATTAIFNVRLSSGGTLAGGAYRFSIHADE